MSEQNRQSVTALQTAGDPTEDPQVWKALKPYIGHCLTMNHDINNPLAGILGYSEFILMDDDLPPAHRKHMEQIADCAERIKRLVETLCDEKIALAEKIDLRSVTDAYVRAAKKLE